jgi:hypothetical protein
MKSIVNDVGQTISIGDIVVVGLGIRTFITKLSHISKRGNYIGKGILWFNTRENKVDYLGSRFIIRPSKLCLCIKLNDHTLIGKCETAFKDFENGK